MADNPQSPSDTPTEDKPKQQEAAPSKSDIDWSIATGGKFKSAEEVAKAWQERESLIGKQSEKVRQLEEFNSVVQPLLEEIRSDPKLFNELDNRLRRKTDTPETPKEEPKNQPKQDDVRNVTVDLLINRFEEKHGIAQLSEEERKDVRKQIGDKIYELTGSYLTDVDLRRLNGVMENAFKLVKTDAQGSKLEALLSGSKENDEAALSTIPSSKGKPEASMSPEEAKVAERLGLTREQYLKGKR